MKTKEEQLYFENEDSNFTETLESLINNAIYEGLETITILKADKEHGETGFIWCTYYGNCVEKSDCSKSQCSHYESKSGRGRCLNKGTLYTHGESVTIEIKK